MNVLIILGVLFASLLLLLPILEKTAKPVEEEQMSKYSRIIMFLMMGLIVASSIKLCMGS